MNRKHMSSFVLIVALVASCTKNTTEPTSVQRSTIAFQTIVSDSVYQAMVKGGMTESMLARGKEGDFLFGKVTMQRTDSGMVFTRPLNDVTLHIGEAKIRTGSDGNFDVPKLPDGSYTVHIMSDSGSLGEMQMSVIAGNAQPLLVTYPIEKTMAHGAIETAAGCYIPCLDNNGVGPLNFINSDCYASLFRFGFLPCWMESMDREHDHTGWRWCNCWSNCSLICHYWNYNKQFWHTHGWWPWI